MRHVPLCYLDYHKSYASLWEEFAIETLVCLPECILSSQKCIPSKKCFFTIGFVQYVALSVALARLHMTVYSRNLASVSWTIHFCATAQRPCVSQPQKQNEVLLSISWRSTPPCSSFAWPEKLKFMWTSLSLVWCWDITSYGVIQSLTSPRFLCSSVSSSWCLILIWAISCCRASLRLESVPELNQERAQFSD